MINASCAFVSEAIAPQTRYAILPAITIFISQVIEYPSRKK